MPEATDILDLDTIPDPKFRLSFKGKPHEYDPFDIAQSIRGFDVPNPGADKFLAEIDTIRKVFGFPAEAEKSDDNPTPSIHQVLAILARFTDFMQNEVEALKKLHGRTPNSSPGESAPSSPAPSPEPTAPPSSAD